MKKFKPVQMDPVPEDLENIFGESDELPKRGKRAEQEQLISEMYKKFTDNGDPVIYIDSEYKEVTDPRFMKKIHFTEEISPDDFSYTLLSKDKYAATTYGDSVAFMRLKLDSKDCTRATENQAYAADLLYRWWECIGTYTYPRAKRLYILSDKFGYNADINLIRLWKYLIIFFMDKYGIELVVSFVPNDELPIEPHVSHRLYGYTDRKKGTVISTIATFAPEDKKIIFHDSPKNYFLLTGVTDSEMTVTRRERLRSKGYWNFIVLPRGTW